MAAWPGTKDSIGTELRHPLFPLPQGQAQLSAQLPVRSQGHGAGDSLVHGRERLAAL